MKNSSKVLLVALLSGAGLSSLSLLPRYEGEMTGQPKAQLTKNRLPGDKGKAVQVTEPELDGVEGEELFQAIGGFEKGQEISLPLPGGGSKVGRLNYVNHYPNGARATGGVLEDGTGTFEIAVEPWGYRGFILQKEERAAYVYSSGAEGQLQVARRPIGEVICEPEPHWEPLAKVEGPDPEKAAIYNGGRTVGIIGEAIPILHSLPRAEAVVYLDFDGEVIEGHSWEGGARIVAPAYNLPASEVTDMWRRVAEDFAPFEVNVTTDLQAYLRAPQGLRIRCITTTNNFASAGGVAFNNTFRESGEPVCWNFYRGNGGAVVISHEVGHTFGLHHDDTTTQGYYGGHGSGAMSWGPIMGAPYSQNICQWSKGDYVNAAQQQDDLLQIGAAVARRVDDHSPYALDATPLVIAAGGAASGNGVIASPDDVDAFTFQTGGGNLNLQFNGAPNSPNLDIEAKLYNAAGTLVATASPANQLSATLTASLASGSYTVTVDGVGNGTWASNGYDDYGSLGEYTISGTVPSPGWKFRVAANALNGTVLGTISPGATGYSIVAGNTGTAFSIQSGTGVLSVANAAALTGTFNLTVNSSAGSLPVQIRVGPLRGAKHEIWTGLGGGDLGGLTGNANYPNSPNLTRHAGSLQGCYQGDNYGQKFSGYLLPAESGNHVFWTTADDFCELWLSTDANPNNKVRVAYNTGNTAADNWTAQGNQQSAPISLVAGQRYYIEFIHRENGGGDHASVAWQTPTQNRRLIGTEYLEYPGTMPNRAPWLTNMTFRVRDDATTGTVVGTLQAGDFEPGSVLSAFTITGGNTGNAFALNASTGVLTVSGALSFATLPKYLLDLRVTDSGGLQRTAQLAVEVEPRAVKRELWTGIGGNDVVNLTSHANFPNSPNATNYQAFFETPTNFADNYGQRLTGYIRAPETGSYTFWVASDDDSELWLSTTTNAANKVRIAYVDGSTGSREWGKFPSQRSANINLVGGQFYYVEVLQKEGVGGDNLAVSWSGPDFGQVILGAPHVTQQFYNHSAPVISDRTVTVFDRETSVTTVTATDWSDPGVTFVYSITGGNADGAFTIDPNTGVITATGAMPLGTRVLTITVTEVGPIPLATTINLTVNVVRPGLKREVWTGLPGGQALSGLTNWLYFPYSPDLTGYTHNFKAPTGYGENYGQRLSGYVIPPETGNYTFWIASDDAGQLSLSSDANPANRKVIGTVNGSVGEEQWTAQGNQQSAVIPLVAGQRYYIEALQKEGNGGDHLAVAWQGPNFGRTVISGNHLEYPDLMRPTLRREVWNTANPVAWTRNPATNLMDWVNTIYAEGFEATGALSGNATETGAGTWGASTGWARNNGVGSKAANGDALALLPFTPAAGKVYTLSLEIDPTNNPGSTDWFSLGFLNQPASNAALYLQSSVFPNYGGPWMLVRANGNTSGNTVQAFSNGTSNPQNSNPVISAVGTYDTIAVVLDTRGTNWISRYYVNGSQRAAHTHTSNPTIQSVGFSGFATAKGNVRNFRLSTNDNPAPGSGDFDGTLMAFKGPIDSAENFSQRLSGFIVPQVTGSYTFWLASDDDGELLISTDESPANLSKIASVNGYVNPEAWDAQPSQQSAARTLVEGRRYYVEVRHRDGSFGDHVAVAWQGPGIARQIVANQYLEHPSAPADRSLLKREVWNGITGNNISDLTGAATYPAAPSVSGTLAANAGLRAATGAGDNYGQRVSGYLVAPDSGRYTFWIASDDGGELWLSTDENPANRVRLAFVSNSVGEMAWDSQASQKSVPVALEAGRRYYIELLHKEGAGGDYLAAAWQGPGFARRVIPNQFLEHPLVIPGKASIRREVWLNLAGEQVTNLTSAPPFVAGTPGARGRLNTFETPENHGDTYGQRLAARLVAPESGVFKFWIAGDDSTELWLSTDSNPANRIRIAYSTGFTNFREWTKFPTQESAGISLVAGNTYHIEALHKEGSSLDHLSVAWQGPSFSRQVLDGRCLDYPGTPPASPALKRELWTGIGGESISDLTNLGTYPNSPNQTLTLDSFAAPFNWGNNYGQKISGYLIAPRSGDYTFWIASDDDGELWLSTTGDPAAKTRIAYADAATGFENWTNNASQTSATITLTAGQRCYIEALQKEGGGDDYLSVAWQGPGFSRQIIRKDFLEYPGLPLGETQGGSPIAPPAVDPGYTFWLNYLGLSGNDRLANADPDLDGIVNSMEFVLGGKPSGPDAISTTLLPQVTLEPAWVNFVFRRADVASTVGAYVQYSTTPGNWVRAENGVGNVQITTVDDGFGAGMDRVTVRIPRTGSRMFVRLNSNMP
ncbi:PA14 domain-containing protein [Luteolibacter sp. GHJ8]|uniref:PA14 domain-containing protein n=1 Tax=Luteolibacter rhizosphaerae TaxID=2989719 RepID=A0ABT3G2F9_9BACT|nr:PA14 domain-containing protein [Luteolibacter rhizosphaerae]MCW1914010.1 PA14 domain-containing protein [Luteolibacter rhizosphaerae]